MQSMHSHAKKQKGNNRKIENRTKMRSKETIQTTWNDRRDRRENDWKQDPDYWRGESGQMVDSMKSREWGKANQESDSKRRAEEWGDANKERHRNNEWENESRPRREWENESPLRRECETESRPRTENRTRTEWKTGSGTRNEWEHESWKSIFFIENKKKFSAKEKGT